jgi:radical SAM protein with 4Fe4S-binding SPASM domain
MPTSTTVGRNQPRGQPQRGQGKPESRPDNNFAKSPAWVHDLSKWWPRNLDLDITSRCNQNCKYCYLGQIPPEQRGDMSMETAKQVLQYIALLAKKLPPKRHIAMCMFGGEPFLNFEVMKYIVEECDRRKLPTGRAVMTNGATATPEQIQWCKTHRITPKRSATGCPEACALTRPGNYLDRYHAETALYGDYGRPRRITVIPETAAYLMGTLRYFTKLGYFGMLDFSTDDYADWSDAAIAEHKSQLTRMAKEIVRQFRLGYVLHNEMLFLVAKKAFETSRVLSIGCGAGWGLQAITFDGYVVPCVKPDTLVNTGVSLRSINTFKEGDSVVGHSGGTRKITKVWKRPYSGEMVKIRTKGSNEPVSFTPEHPIYVVSGKPCIHNRPRCRPDCARTNCHQLSDFDWTPDWKPAREVCASDFVVYPIDRREIPIDRLDIYPAYLAPLRSIPPSIEVTPELMRFFGWYISEGCAHPTRGSIHLNLHEDELADAEWIVSFIGETFGLPGGISHKGDHGLTVYFNSTVLARWLLHLTGRGAINKHIPDVLMTLPPARQLPLLQSLFYGDGGVDRKRAAFHSTISRQLSHQVKTLLLRQNVIPATRFYPASRHGNSLITRRDEHRVVVYDRGSCEQLFGERWSFLPLQHRCPKAGWITGDYVFTPVDSVTTELYDGLVFNLEVEHDQSYSLANVVAHNCHRFLREPRDSDFCGGKLSDVLAGKPVAFGPTFRQHVERCSRKEETEECFNCAARQTCQHGCAHVSWITSKDLRKTPKIRCEISRHYRELAFWVHTQLKGIDGEWFNRKPTRLLEIPEDA